MTQYHTRGPAVPVWAVEPLEVANPFYVRGPADPVYFVPGPNGKYFDESIIDHNSLKNLLVGDAHPQYHNDARGDIRYPLRSEWLQNGFPDPDNVGISWDDVTLTLTVQPVVGTFDYFHEGIRYTVSAPDTATITDTEGMWVFYYSGTTLTALQGPTHSQIDDIIEDECIVASLYWDATNNDGRLIAERHGSLMSPATHHWLHDNMGAMFREGMALENLVVDGNGSLDSHGQFGVAEGEFYDEDIEHELSSVISTAGLEIWYLDGSNWRWTTNPGFSVLNGPAGRLAWNDSGTQSDVGLNNFVLCHVFATNIGDDTGANEKFVAIQGQAEYGNVAAARAGAETEINILAFGAFPVEEAVPIATVIFQSGNYANSLNGRVRSTDAGDDYVDWRFSNLKASGGTVQDHGVLAGLPDDDHGQYFLLAGRTGGQIGYGGIDASDNLTLNSTLHATKGDILLQTGGGNVHIGSATANLASQLSIVSPSAVAADVSIFTTDGDRSDFLALNIYGYGQIGSLLNHEKLWIYWDTADSTYKIESEAQGTATIRPLVLQTEGNDNQLYLKADGKVGINTTTPDVKLHVYAASAGVVTASGLSHAAIENNSDTGISILTPDVNYGWLIFGSPSDSVGASVYWSHDADEMCVQTQNSGGELKFATHTGVEAMRIDASQNVGIGTATPDGRLHVDQQLSSGAIPVLTLDQADLSEEFVNFITTVGASNPIDTAVIGSYYGKARVAVNGTFKYVALYNS